MNKIEAMEWAADYAERSKLFSAPLNSRGYPVDGWKNPTPAERAQIICDLADKVVEEPKLEQKDSRFEDLAATVSAQLPILRSAAMSVRPMQPGHGTTIENAANIIQEAVHRGRSI